jgi:hypothetical protein
MDPPKNFQKKQLAEALDPTRVYGRPKFMKKSIKVDQKRKRGRPATGRDPMVSSRIPAELVAAIDTWAAQNAMTRSKAICRLLEAGLKARLAGSKK